ncbi:hypothetical protein [Desertivirga xinjiangensis]|uniref:hypothetical protein n=1 Tax=Desertivirga xinjiangensis TaxID=539206 RepID=UPI00210B556F|nr:hypothetical protein [Pedobacter xinjiangensis]
MKYLRLYLILILNFSIKASGQSTDLINTGKATGVIVDSIDQKSLLAATASVYQSNDTSLVAYQLSNSNGRFYFKNLPHNVQLQLVVSHIGYEQYRQKFVIPGNLQSYNFDTLKLHPLSKVLNEVKVTAYSPPLVMNGDTLEFKADAFKLDRNAVVEDLMRKLAGITLWGDGTITFNGKSINHVFVNGKPFFGSDARIATQNLPKNVVDKIQIFPESKITKPSDSAFNVNIKLKKEYKAGLFGKTGLGLGTGSRYTADGMLSFYSPSTQVSVAGTANNVNAVPNSIDLLMRYNSFKERGPLAYQADFSLPGSHKPRVIGLYLQQNFISQSTLDKNNRLEVSYFFKQDLNDINSATQTLNQLRPDSSLSLGQFNSTSTFSYNHRITADYKLKNERVDLNITPSLFVDQNSNSSQVNTSLTSSTLHILNKSTTSYEDNDSVSNIAIKASILGKPLQLQLDYAFRVTDKSSRRSIQTTFTPNESPSDLATNYNRRYKDKTISMINDFRLRWDNLQRHLFKTDQFDLFNIGFHTDLKSSSERLVNDVNDFDSLLNRYVINSYLTNQSHYKEVDIKPGLNLLKSWSKVLNNRYDKSFEIVFNLKNQLFYQQNFSQKHSQNFDRKYSRFIPAATITYSRGNGNNRRTTISLDGSRTAIYPTVNLVAPLVDSSNIYFKQHGNFSLRPGYKKELNFSIKHLSVGSKQSNAQYLFSVVSGTVSNALSDSLAYDHQGRVNSYPINIAQSVFYEFRARFDSQLILFSNQMQVYGLATLNNISIPRYINGKFVNTINNSTSLFFSTLYWLKENISVKLEHQTAQSYIYQNNSQAEKLRSLYNHTTFSTGFDLAKKIVFNSSLDYNHNSATYLSSRNFILWNASATLRFLKGNQAEIKLSALDILRQNSTIISYSSANSITTGRNNVLQQYFMLGLAYYPRKFGISQ